MFDLIHVIVIGGLLLFTGFVFGGPVWLWLEDRRRKPHMVSVLCPACEIQFAPSKPTSDYRDLRHELHGTEMNLADAEGRIADLQERIAEVRKLHEPTTTTTVAIIDENGEREIEPDSAEEIMSRDVVCMSCVGYPTAPCRTLQALDGKSVLGTSILKDGGR